MFSIKNRRYLGSKAKLLNFIDEVVKNNCGPVDSMVDLFAGTGNVAWHFNTRNRKIIVNDILFSNVVFYHAFFGKEEIDEKKLVSLIAEYNSIKGDLPKNYFSKNFSNTYFSDANCRKIGYIREDIQKRFESGGITYRESCYLLTSLLYAMDKIANTVGHYDAYRLHGDLERDLVLETLSLPRKGINDNNEIYQEDANELVKKIKADLVYIDPPYNSRQYCDAYHVLENVASWKKPKVYGVARKMDRSELKSKYCTNSAPKQFDGLVSNINAKYILVSYNNMGTKGAGRSQAKISDSDIISSLEKRGTVKVFETDFNQFTAGKTDIHGHKERLFLCLVGKNDQTKLMKTKKSDDSEDIGYAKSPLNYTGGKFKLLPQLVERFPKDINTFIDVFGGGFNVGVNIPSKQTVYNDKQTEVVEIISLFYKYDYHIIANKIDELICQNGLSDSYSNGYEKYGCISNSGLGSFNKKPYENLRAKYNAMKKNDENKFFVLLTLIIFAFNNQVRFNSRGEFNMPVGKRDFNASVRKHIKDFSIAIKKRTVTFLNESFEHIDYLRYQDPFIYCDPPYYLGLASYNESDGWTERDETSLLAYLKKASDDGVRFALSNVIEHKGKTHVILKKWVEENRFNLIYIKSNYSNSNYHIKDKLQPTVEVLVTNY
jgi:adenine-specific DNA-methyltransferase